MKITGINFFFQDYQPMGGRVDFITDTVSGSVKLDEQFCYRVLEMTAGQLQNNLSGFGSFGVQNVVEDSLNNAGSSAVNVAQLRMLD